MMMDVILTTYQGAILGPIAKLLGYIMEALYSALSVIGIENTGICIILFTIIVNALMMPMQFKQQKFSKMTSIMNPELMAIQEKYKNKKDQASQQKMSLETQAVYQKYGVSPASGCLPMLITFPILFALWRVIYNIPAYVPQVYEIYEDLAQVLMDSEIALDTLTGKEYIKSATYVVTDAVKNAEKNGVNINYYIDILSQFTSSGWDELSAKYSEHAAIIKETAARTKDINFFLGLNIADTPSIKSVSVLIPILSIITQVISTKLSMAGSPQMQQDSDNPTMQSMKTMNTVMPFVSGAMCLMFPIGVGIYWIAGNVFRIVQSIFINLYFSKIDMDEEIQKNVEKAKKRYEKMGMDSSTLDQAAKRRTSNIKVQDTKKNENSTSSKKENNGSKVKKESNKAGGNKKYKEGSIAAYANMMSRSDDK